MPVRPQPTKPYKNANNNWMTGALFWDRNQIRQLDMWDPVFSLYGDKKDCTNCRKTFVELGDPTGYKWAMEYLGDMEHWHKLMKTAWFRDAYEVWLAELNMKLKSEAIDRLREIAAGDTSQAMAANKYLASRDYEKAERGRPSKAEMKGELKRLVEMDATEKDDLERIGGLKVINGGKYAARGPEGD